MMIKKMSTTTALVRFRSEIGDLRINQKKRLRLLERFKEAWERSLDYDLASQSALSRMIPEFAINDDEEKSFKSSWLALNKAERPILLDETDSFERSELRDQLKEMILIQGLSPSHVAKEISQEYDLEYESLLKEAVKISQPQTRKGIKDFLNGFLGSSEVSKLRNYIDKELLSGTQENVIVNSLILDAQRYFNRKLSEKELDIILFNIKGEKVRLREAGKLT